MIDALNMDQLKQYEEDGNTLTPEMKAKMEEYKIKQSFWAVLMPLADAQEK